MSKLRAYSKEKLRLFIQDAYLIQEKSKDLAKTNYDLGMHHLQLGNLYDAILRFKIAIWLRPGFAPAYYHLGRTFFSQGKTSKAEQAFLQALQHEPNYPEVPYMLASLRKDKTAVKNIPLSIIRDYFNDMAPRYDEEMLRNQHYVGHIALYEVLADSIENKTLAVDVLDLGCGTGLCGTVLKERIAIGSLTGVDVAEEMLRQARKLKIQEKPVYDYLKHKDMLAFLQKTDRKYDIIVAALSFNYLGDLTELLTACKGALRPNGLLAFSTEESPQADIILNDTMQNFCHSLSYIHEQGAKAGFAEVSLKKTVLLENALAVQCVLKNVISHS